MLKESLASGAKLEPLEVASGSAGLLPGAAGPAHGSAAARSAAALWGFVAALSFSAAAARAADRASLRSVVGAAFVCSVSIVEFTVPQLVNLSRGSSDALPPVPFLPHRMAIFAKAILPQWALTVAQFVLVIELRNALDLVLHRQRAVHLSLAYGTASVPFVAAKYNLLIADVYQHFGRAAPTKPQGLLGFWRRNIAPGFLWSFIRDCCSVGGGIVFGPMLSAALAAGEPPTFLEIFLGGLLAGMAGGLATQVFHNAALTAGRMAEAGETPGTLECMRRLFAEKGPHAFYFNFPFRVGMIALTSAVLTVMTPFAK